jgi:hypothetical protein
VPGTWSVWPWRSPAVGMSRLRRSACRGTLTALYHHCRADAAARAGNVGLGMPPRGIRGVAMADHTRRCSCHHCVHLRLVLRAAGRQLGRWGNQFSERLLRRPEIVARTQYLGA